MVILYIFPVLLWCEKKNLATLASWRNVDPEFESHNGKRQDFKSDMPLNYFKEEDNNVNWQQLNFKVQFYVYTYVRLRDSNSNHRFLGRLWHSEAARNVSEFSKRSDLFWRPVKKTLPNEELKSDHHYFKRCPQSWPERERERENNDLDSSILFATFGGICTLWSFYCCHVGCGGSKTFPHSTLIEIL
jgi:hypothetical protein